MKGCGKGVWGCVEGARRFVGGQGTRWRPLLGRFVAIVSRRIGIPQTKLYKLYKIDKLCVDDRERAAGLIMALEACSGENASKEFERIRGRCAIAVGAGCPAIC